MKNKIIPVTNGKIGLPWKQSFGLFLFLLVLCTAILFPINPFLGFLWADFFFPFTFLLSFFEDPPLLWFGLALAVVLNYFYYFAVLVLLSKFKQKFIRKAWLFWILFLIFQSFIFFSELALEIIWMPIYF